MGFLLVRFFPKFPVSGLNTEMSVFNPDTGNVTHD